MKKVKYNIIRFVFFLFLLSFCSFSLFPQQQVIIPDTLKMKRGSEVQSQQNRQNQERNNQNDFQREGQVNRPGEFRNNGNEVATGAKQGLRQVKSARPDMSKARGARPPAITRPSGSQIPKGIGKPGGIGRRGGR